jgi:catechol 2,3-dioxygenase-like lactoylglutathione lyase family enzyme
MKPRIHVLTLAVDDLQRALRFYRDGLALQTAGVIGTEFAGDETRAAGAIALFHLYGGLILALYPRTDLAKDASIGRSSGTQSWPMCRYAGVQPCHTPVAGSALISRPARARSPPCPRGPSIRC